MSFKEFESKYSDTLDYMDTASDFRLFIEPKPGEDQVTLGAGTHAFDFQFKIPPNCPSSYESRDGHVRYLMKVIIGLTVIDQIRNVGFSVINSLDLNSCAPDVLVSCYFMVYYPVLSSFLAPHSKERTKDHVVRIFETEFREDLREGTKICIRSWRKDPNRGYHQ